MELVKRLRDEGSGKTIRDVSQLNLEAADEIELLRADLKFLVGCSEQCVELLNDQLGSGLIEDEIDALQTRIESIKQRHQIA